MSVARRICFQDHSAFGQLKEKFCGYQLFCMCILIYALGLKCSPTSYLECRSSISSCSPGVHISITCAPLFPSLLKNLNTVGFFLLFHLSLSGESQPLSVQCHPASLLASRRIKHFFSSVRGISRSLQKFLSITVLLFLSILYLIDITS